ncbi:hypothetical protein OKW42_002301 [Paraburkholderia sp. WC7.3d]
MYVQPLDAFERLRDGFVILAIPDAMYPLACAGWVAGVSGAITLAYAEPISKIGFSPYSLLAMVHKLKAPLTGLCSAND